MTHLALNVFGDQALPGALDGMSKNVIVIVDELRRGKIAIDADYKPLYHNMTM